MQKDKYLEAFDTFDKCKKTRTFKCLDCPFLKEHGYSCRAPIKKVINEKRRKEDEGSRL